MRANNNCRTLRKLQEFRRAQDMMMAVSQTRHQLELLSRVSEEADHTLQYQRDSFGEPSQHGTHEAR